MSNNLLRRQISLTEDKIFIVDKDLLTNEDDTDILEELVPDESEKDYLEEYERDLENREFMGHYNPDTENFITIHKYTEVFVQGMLLVGICICLYITLI
jgi:hypothetical protein